VVQAFDKMFHSRIRRLGLPEGGDLTIRMYTVAKAEFNNRIMRDFKNNGQQFAVAVFPGDELDSPEAGIEEGHMKFSNDDILQCFESTVSRILELIREQIRTVRAQDRGLKVNHLKNTLPVSCDC
jgi:hypothetical protein